MASYQAFNFCKRLIQLLAAAFMALLVLFSIFFAGMQSKWAKEKAREMLVKALREQGWQVEIEELSGTPPFQWTAQKIHLQINQRDSFDLYDVKMRLAFFPMLRRHLVINYLHVREIAVFYAMDSAEQNSNLNALAQRLKVVLPFEGIAIPSFHFSIKTLKAPHVALHNTSSGFSTEFSLEAAGEIRRDHTDFFLDLNAAPLDDRTSFVKLFIDGNILKGFSRAQLDVSLGTLTYLKGFYQIPFDGAFSLQATAKGLLETWGQLLSGKERSSSPLEIDLSMETKNFLYPKHPFFERDWKMVAHLSLNSDMSGKMNSLHIKSDLLHVKAQADFIKSALQKSTFSLGIPDLALLSSYAHLPLDGELFARGFYDGQQIKLRVNTKDLLIAKQPFDNLDGMLQAEHIQNTWDGTFQMQAKEALIPFELNSAIAIDNYSIFNLRDLSLKTDELTISGHLNFNKTTQALDGALYANASSLDRINLLFPEVELTGNGGLNILFSAKEKDGKVDQDMKLFGLFKNFHYQNTLIDDLIIQTDLKDLYGTLKGDLFLEAEKLYSPKFYLNYCSLNTAYENGVWPFELQAFGTLQDPLEVAASGVWQKEKSLFTMNLAQLSGTLLKNPFSLPSPCSMAWNGESFQIQNCDLKMGQGSLSLNGNFTKTESTAELQAQHFPIDLLTISRPNFSLKGWITASGQIKGDQENLDGFLNVVLENADVGQTGRKAPIKAKGSLQAHLSQKKLQLHADLHASGSQFCDLTATIPMQYQLYPLRFRIDEVRPLSAELITEGALEEIFDFINIGSHRATGLISSRLFLSKTLSSPALQGNIELQNGSYENYFTGTILKEINAEVEALNHQIKLLSMSCKDDADGSVTAEGKLELLPKEKFPYTFQTELQKLHTLRFDTIDCYFTGPLYIKGNSESALAQGNLIVPEANLKIPEKLLVDLPILPITYINKPLHLDLSSLAPLPVFPLHIDLELSATEHVYVTGKGLNSEWEGNVHLTGTNAQVAAGGKLKLINGEYQFSGKTFKLTEGEITFSDKPNSSGYINLSGTLDLSDIVVTAYLRGPLSSPLLTFQSNPHMSTSSILARIIFNKDISDISHPEAIQLANTLISLSGGAAPDVLDAIRRSIGVDRLTIVSARPGTDQIAVQIGKYLIRGVMITLSQSATSSQVIVEVELKQGFIFQAETQEEQEGKFTLKWNKNY